MPTSTSQNALCNSLAAIIEKHGATNPELKADLLIFQSDLNRAILINDRGAYIKSALMISYWIKFIFDHLPPPS
jgi:hypothetical protein